MSNPCDSQADPTAPAETMATPTVQVEAVPLESVRAPSATPPPDATVELEAARAEREQLREQMLRAQAELVNFQTRARREREAERRYRNEALLRDLLPVLDNFDRALTVSSDSPEVKALLDGIRLLQREIFRVLESHGVRSFESTGQTFDPTQQEVVETLPTTEHPDKQVVATLRKGYFLHDRVVQPAQVRIAVGRDPEEPPVEPE